MEYLPSRVSCVPCSSPCYIHPMIPHPGSLCRIATLGATLACAPLAFTQTLFPVPVDLTDPIGGISNAALGDMTGDGLADLVVADVYDGRIRVIESLGGGVFGPARTLADNITDVVALTIGDVDGDGDGDVVVSRITGASSAIVWIENRAPGLPGVVRNVGDFVTTPAAYFTRVEVRDMDGDGDGDVVAGPLLGQVIWIETLQVSTPSAIVRIGPNDGDSWLLSDVDADGLVDFVSPDPVNREVRIQKGQQGGTFDPPLVVLTQVPASSAVLAPDLNGDGLADLVVIASGSQQLHAQVAPFSYASPIDILPSGATAGLPFLLEDLDADGDLDALYQADPFPLPLPLSWSENIGGTVGPPRFASDVGAALLRIQDVTGDGLPDLVSGTAFLPNQGSSAPSLFGEWVQMLPPLDVHDVVLADLDGDSDQDVVAASKEDGALVLFRNRGDSTFELPARLDDDVPGASVLAAGDVDNDGDVDLLVAREVAGQWSLSVHLNSGASQVVNSVLLPLALSTTTEVELQLFDYDEDGDLDLTVLGRDPTGLDGLVGINDGSGLAYVFQPLPSSPSDLVAVDLGGDGRVDLVECDALGVRVRAGLGGGAYAAPSPIGTPVSGARLLVGDLNGDSLLDVVVFRFNGVSRSLRLPGGGYGSWENVVPMSASPLRSAELGLADLNGDGVLDLIVSPYDLVVDVPIAFIGDGSGDFPGLELLAAGPYIATSVDVGDLDDDGDPDLVFFSLDGSKVQFHENNAVERSGTAFCVPASINSAGLIATMSAYGIPSMAAQNLRLRAANLPLAQFGFFVGSLTQSSPVPAGNSLGLICLGGAIGRYDEPFQIRNSGPGGVMDLSLDPMALETTVGQVAAIPGQTWYFQAWHRDLTPSGAATSNFTGGISLLFQ